MERQLDQAFADPGAATYKLAAAGLGIALLGIGVIFVIVLVVKFAFF